MQPKNLKKIAAALISCGMLFAAAPAGAGTLDDVLNRGEVKCGALGTIAGFSHIDEKGRYLGLDSDKLPEDCFYSVIRQAGNYGEIYGANAGESTPIGIPRAGSPNAPRSKGGVLYAPPMR